MDARIQELIDFTESKIGLESYHLARYSLNRKVNLNETINTLDMEWLAVK